MREVHIRQVMVEDAEKLLDYTKQVGRETDNLSFGSEGLPYTVEQEQEILKQILKTPRSAFYVAVKGEKIVGTASLGTLSRRRKHWAVLGISVLRSEWGQGVGSALLRHLIDFASDNDIEMIELEVRSDNHRAIQLYRKFGFERIGTLPNRVCIDGHYKSCDVMYLELPIESR